MPIYRVTHSDMMGGVISEQFFDSKNKAKKALRRKFSSFIRAFNSRKAISFQRKKQEVIRIDVRDLAQMQL